MRERVGRYELLEPLGRGGMGEVFLARRWDEPETPARRVVVKRLLPHLSSDPALTTRFLSEAKAAARVRHRNVAGLVELGAHEGRLFLVMEYVRGVDLAALTAREPLAPALVARVVADAARGLHAAHVAADPLGRPLGVAHGDVTPRNLVVGTDGVTRVIDFGLATVRGAPRPDAGGGTPGYLAPEQALHGVVDPKTDQFALGVVAWECFTGARLFEGDDDAQTLAAVTACEVPPLAPRWPSAPTSLEALVGRMVSREPDERLPTCAEVAQALEAWLEAPDGGEARAALASRVARVLPAALPREHAPALRATAAPPSPTGPARTPGQRQALARLSALPGPLTLEVMEAALEAAGHTPALDVLQALVDAGHLRRRGDDAFELSVRP
ncbi:MAG: serine/threonine protein kinase [Myxococcaceae bacterium]|jgi:serine/threonine protein kinase|nr:serine/threonine protein kinase [Myxococcaceae bacterium]MCA3014946.1 serine/threonine protein kinase [Myxococcaceae bacterium]